MSKYKDPGVAVYDTLSEAREAFCTHQNCTGCPLSCETLVKTHAELAAELMGLEIIQEEKEREATMGNSVQYKAPDGEIFESIGKAARHSCVGISCSACPLEAPSRDAGMPCVAWANVNPEEAAKLMGLEAVEVETAEMIPPENIKEVRLDEQAAADDPDEEEPMTTYECKNCGGEIEAHQPIFCPWCGLRFDGLDKKDGEIAPPNVRRHRGICTELNELYERKDHDYGDSFHQSFQEEGMAMARIRLGDKLNRFKTLSRQEIPFEDERKVKDESIRDTLIDLANYAIMTVMEMEDDSNG